MRLALLRNLREEQNLSMKLTADRIERALSPSVTIQNVLPPSASLGGRLAEYASTFVRYPNCVRDLRADVYHIVDHAYAHLLRALPAQKTVVTCHDLMLLRLARGHFGKRSAPRIATALLSYSVNHLRNARRVIAVSEATASDAIDMCGLSQERVSVVYQPVDAVFMPRPKDIDRGELRRELGFGSRPVLLHVGESWFYKNIEGVLRALAVVNDRRSERPVLVRLGKPLTAKQLALARSLGVIESVREVGTVSTERLRHYYWAADALVFPSLWEGFGWPVVEAMACGLPVVCSANGALKEVAGNAAEIVDSEDPLDIARGIRVVLEDGTRRSDLISSGLINVRRFDTVTFATRLMQLYSEIADTRGAE